VAKEGDLDKAVTDINKKYGAGTLLRASEAVSLVVDRLPSNVFIFDTLVGGGFPRGRISMIKGDYSTGKSALCLATVAVAQRTCRFCGYMFEFIDMVGEVHEFPCKCKKKVPMGVVWLDAEHSFDPTWASKWNVDTDSMYLIQAEVAEQAVDVADHCIRQNCDLLVIDSIAALAPEVEVVESMQKQQMGIFARVMNKALRKWTSGMNAGGLLAETKCTILLVNQIRIDLGGYRPKQTSPGGKGLDFFASLEVKLKREGWIEQEGSKRPVGIRVSFVVKKNKTWPASNGGVFDLYFVSDPPNYMVGDSDLDVQVLRLAVFWDLVKKGGSWFTFPDGTRSHGEAAAGKHLRDNPKLLEELKATVTEKELAWVDTGEMTRSNKEEDEE